jgi:phosphoribosylglycinamide formyltransferase 2
MVTLAGTQNFTEFELHARAILGIPVMDISLVRNGASAVVLANKENKNFPIFTGLNKATNFINTDFKIFGKPSTRPYRRMAVALAYGNEDTSILVEKAKEVAAKINVD